MQHNAHVFDYRRAKLYARWAFTAYAADQFRRDVEARKRRHYRKQVTLQARLERLAAQAELNKRNKAARKATRDSIMRERIAIAIAKVRGQ
jgi:hypothetical protein